MGHITWHRQDLQLPGHWWGQVWQDMNDRRSGGKGTHCWYNLKCALSGDLRRLPSVEVTAGTGSWWLALSARSPVEELDFGGNAGLGHSVPPLAGWSRLRGWGTELDSVPAGLSLACPSHQAPLSKPPWESGGPRRFLLGCLHQQLLAGSHGPIYSGRPGGQTLTDHSPVLGEV